MEKPKGTSSSALHIQYPGLAAPRPSSAHPGPPRRYLPDDRVPQTRRHMSGETTPAAACPFAASARRGRSETAARPLPPLPSSSRRAHRFGRDPGCTLHRRHRPSLHLLVERPWHCWQPVPDRARRTSKYPQPATQARDHHLPWESRLRYHGLLGMKNSSTATKDDDRGPTTAAATAEAARSHHPQWRCYQGGRTPPTIVATPAGPSAKCASGEGYASTSAQQDACTEEPMQGNKGAWRDRAAHRHAATQ